MCSCVSLEMFLIYLVFLLFGWILMFCDCFVLVFGVVLLKFVIYRNRIVLSVYLEWIYFVWWWIFWLGL